MKEGENMIRYVYSTVRVVPHPASGEFANIAAIAGSDTTGEWEVRQLDDEARVRRFCGEDAMTAAREFLTRVGFQIDAAQILAEEDRAGDADPQVTEDWLADMSASHRHVVQLSPPRPVLADTLASAFDAFLPRVLSAPEERRSRGLTKTRLVSDLLRAYRMTGISDRRLLRRPKVTSRGENPYEITSDFVVASSQALQLTQAWSFRAADQELMSRSVRAWGWSMQAIRREGGTAIEQRREVFIPPDVDLRVVGAAPGDSDTAVFKDALGVFAELGATYHDYADLPDVAANARALLGRTTE